MGLHENIETLLNEARSAVFWMSTERHAAQVAGKLQAAIELFRDYKKPDGQQIDIADLVEKLIVANCKLFALCDRKAVLAKEAPSSYYHSEDCKELLAKDVELCKQRGLLKSQLNAALGSAFRDVKSYG